MEDRTVLTAKIITMVILFTVSMLCGLLPLIISLKFDWFTKSKGPDMRTSNQFVQGLLAFGGGVLFATTFMHLLPEVDENVQLLQASGQLPEMPIYLAALIMCCGFFMMYLVEELVHVYIHSRENKTANTSFTRVLSIRRNNDEEGAKDEESKTSDFKGHGHGHAHLHTEGADDSIVAAMRGLLIVLALSIHELFEGLAVGLESSANKVWFMFGAVSAHKYIIAFCIGVELLVAGTKRWLSILYIFTFSFVSALGIGVGILLVGGAGAAQAGIYSVVLQKHSASELNLVAGTKRWLSILYIFTFSFVSALGIGVGILLVGGAGAAQAGIYSVVLQRWLSILYIFTFSFVSALGIGVGILLVGGAGAAQAGIYSVVLQGLACGTLVYVVFFEVWRQDRTGLLQFICSVLGFALMVALELVVELAA
ncbi:ZIP zinc transporter domain-containing protein [Phthorimaea operculella]|nr:ZIP zinc transporter domain-containing protein [Phthorimaea operculella]